MSAHGKKPDPDQLAYLLYAAVYMSIIFLLMRVLPQLGLLLLLIGLLFTAYTAGRKVYLRIRDRAREKRQASSHEFKHRVRHRLRECERSEERFRDEAERVRESIRQLRDDLDRTPTAETHERERGESLIRELQAEFNLRHAKALFFADCAAKLTQLLDRHRLHESINARKKELDVLRETNYDDEAAVEETRYHLEQDSIELETIAALTRDVAVSFKAEQAEALRARLEKLRLDL